MCAPSWVAAPGSTIRCGTVRNWKADMQTPDSEDRSQAYSAFPPCACFTWNQKRGLLPLQRAAFPFIRQADGQYAQKTHDGPEAGQSEFVHVGRPRHQEDHLDIEQDEEDGDQVEADVELHARVAERFEAAFVRRQLVRIGL